MSIKCFDLITNEEMKTSLLEKYNKQVTADTTEQEQKEIAVKIALDYYKQLHTELNTLKDIVGMEKDKYNPVSYNTQQVSDKYDTLITQEEDKLSKLPSVFYDPISSFDSMFDAEDFQTPPTGGLTRLVTLKHNLLSSAKQRLSEIKPLLRANKDNAEEYTRLIKLQNELNDYISGNEAKGITGLEAEIAELDKLDTRAPEFIAPYIEKELSRLDRLIQSKDPISSKEAQQIIKFIKAVGNFNPLAEHPLFHSSEIYDEDGNLLLTDSMVQPYIDWAARATIAERDLDFNNGKIIEDRFNSNPNIQKMFNDRKFTYEDIVNSKEGLKDANWVDMMFMDITSGIFSTNSLMPQVVKQIVDRSLEREYAWSKEINEKINSLTPQVQAELRKLGYGLDNLGFIGIKGVSYDMFSQKFENGSNQSTGNIVHKYSNKWFEDRAEMNTKFWSAIEEAKNEPNDTVKKFLFKKAFDERNEWFKKNTQLINPALISSIVSNPAFSSLSQHFTASQAEMTAHEQLLENLVGKDHLQKVIGSQESKLKQYLVQRDLAIKEITDSEGVTSEDQLSNNGKRSLNIWEAENNPFTAVQYRDTGAATRIGAGEFHSKFGFNDYVPSRTDYYDDNYTKIENNPILKEFYDTIYSATSEMKLKLPHDIQEKMLSTSVPSIEKSIIELILDKDLDFMQSISEVFRRIIDTIKTMFGINEQDQFSYAKVDPITGLPDYQVDNTFINQNLNKINNLFLIKKTNFLSDFNNLSVKKMKNFTKFKLLPSSALTPEISKLISQYTGRNFTTQELIERYGEIIPVGKIIYRNAQHEVAQEKSFDLPKVIKLYTHLTAQYVARQEVLPTVELMKSHYEQIKNQVPTNTGNPVINALTGQNRRKGLRTNANAQFDDWFERVVLGNYGLKQHYGLFNTDKRIYSFAEEKLLKEIDDAIEKAPDDDTKQRLTEIKNKLGKQGSWSAIVSAALRFIRGVGLGWNLNSGISNFVEGQVANSILAASGQDFNPEFIHTVSPTDMIFADMQKQVSPGTIPEKVAKAYWIAKITDILQDNTNELQKASSGSGTTTLRKLNLFYITAKPEHYNQIPVMVATLKSTPITGKNNQVGNVWDAIEMSYDPKSKQWGGSLKPEFATEENKKNWEKFNEQDYFTWKSKIRQIIKNTHGNFDQTAGMMAKSSHVGQFFTTFKTWLPTELYKRFAIPQTDLASGRQFKGRYRSFTPVTAAIHGAVAGSFFFGPVGGLVGIGLGLGYQNSLGVKSGLSTIEDLATISKLLVRKLSGIPINTASKLVGQGRVISTNLGDEIFNKMQKTDGRFVFTKEDFNNYRANAQELAVMLIWFGLLLATKAAFWDDDDKAEDPRRMAHNILANRFMNLGTQIMQFMNPYASFQQGILTLPILTFIKNIGLTVSDASQALIGEDTLTTGSNAGESRTANQFQKTFLPGIFSQSLLGFENQAERQFTPSPYDNLFHGAERNAKDDIRGLKVIRKKELENSGDFTDEQIDKILNKEFPRKKKKQTYVELLDKVDGEE